MSRRPATFGADAVRVIVAPKDIAFGLSRLYALEAPTASDRYLIVRTLPEALGILDLNEDQLPQDR